MDLGSASSGSGSSSAIARASSRPRSMQRWRMRNTAVKIPTRCSGGTVLPNAAFGQ
jgi:hypothetical protein